jgi:prepilin-type N-terminal cleavage/methylation domain-containing protein
MHQARKPRAAGSHLMIARPSRARLGGFTLIELLIVISIIVASLAFVAPAFNSMRSASDINDTSSEIASMLEQARAYAMANNTYVFLGIAEVDAAVSRSARPQTAADSQKGGRVAIQAIASKDGTRRYEITALSNWSQDYGSGQGFMPISKLRRFESTHLADFSKLNGTGKMARILPTSDEYSIGSQSCQSATPFSYPIGANLSGGYQYLVQKVIEFTPQGNAKLVTKANRGAVPKVIEIGLQHSRGNLLPPLPQNINIGNHVLVQLDGITGTVTILKP